MLRRTKAAVEKDLPPKVEREILAPMPEKEEANKKDPVLNIIEQTERRKTLIAQRSERDGKVVYTFDIRLQGGADETVFFDV